MSEKFKAPETYEEAVARKEALLEKINQYNEEYFKGNTSVNEEEIALVQEEYEFLDEFVDIEEEFASEEPKEKNFFDRVSIFVWIYALFTFFSSLYIIQQAIGFKVFTAIYTTDLFYEATNFFLWTGLMGSFLAYPVALLIITVVLKFAVFNRKPENKKAFNYVFLAQIVFLVINFIVSYFTVIDMVYQMLKVK